MLKRNLCPNLTARLATTVDEIAAAQRLRNRVFVEELGASDLHVQEGRETDVFDEHTEHLCLFDQNLEAVDPENSIVGVYRLLDGERAQSLGGFSSESEFDMSAIHALPGKKLELGRSCLDRNYRGGVGMALLWAALSAHIKENDYRYLFGTASYSGISFDGKLESLSHLQHQFLAPLNMRATSLADASSLPKWLDPDQINQTRAMRDTPSLLKAYLRLGGVIGEGAYIDESFNTIDVFVLMDTKSMIEKFKKMYEV